MPTVFNQSLWGDEAFSAILSMKSIAEILEIISRDTSPPLWNIFEHLVFQYLGTEEIYIRGLAFTFFLGAVFFTYKIGSFAFGRKTGFLAAILTFFNPFFFTYAFEGRMYSIMSLGVTASMYYFLRIFYNHDLIRNKDKAGYIFFTLWALYSHHFAFFTVIFQGLWWAYELVFGKRERSKKMLGVFLITGLGYLPWLYPLYSQTKMVGGGFWLGKPNEKDLIGIIIEYLAVGIRNNNLKLPLINYPFYQVPLVFAALLLFLRRWHKNIRFSIYLTLWFLGPIVLTWVISQKFQSIFFNRYLLYTIPAAMLILASSKRSLTNLLTLLLIFSFAIIDFQYFTNPTKLPFKDLAAYVKQERHEADFLINWNSKAHHLWETKYYGIPAPVFNPSQSELPFFVGTALMQKTDVISEIPVGVKRVGVVTSGPIEEINLPGYIIGESKIIDNLKFVWYSKKLR